MSSPPPSEYVAQRRIGDADVTVISDGELPALPLVAFMRRPDAELRRAVPELDAEGNIPFGMNVAHVRIGGASVLIDSGWDGGPSHDRHGPYRPSPGVEAGLAAIGVEPGQVTHVLLTHNHGDHIVGTTVERGGQRVARFPNARHAIGEADWAGNPARGLSAAAVAAGPAATEGLDVSARSQLLQDYGRALHLGALERLGLLDLVAGDREVAPGVTVVHAPGESLGHSIVRVESAGERFYFLGDLLHYPFEVDHPDWVAPPRDPVAMRASRERLFAEAAETNALLVCAHWPFPGWFRIRREGARYRWIDA